MYIMTSEYKMLFGIFITVVAIAHCQMLILGPSGTLCIRRNKYVNCGNLDLTSVPVDIPEDTETLILRSNSISSLPPGSFSRFPNLLILDLSRNKLNKLDKDLFKGVHMLQALDLSYNNDLAFDNVSFPIGLFLPLGRSLQSLLINAALEDTVTPITSYPDQTFADLYNLRNLHITMFTDVTFGPGFGNLTRLQVLQGSECHIAQLYNHTLKHLRNSELQYIDFSSCSIYYIEPGTFSGLHKLKRLDLSHNGHLGLETALDSLGPLEHQQLEEILLVKVNHFTTITVGKALWMKLKNICVETFDVSDNVIGGIDLSPTANFTYPECYKTLRLARHLITQLPSSVVFVRLFTNLEDLDISGSPGPGHHHRQRRMASQLARNEQTIRRDTHQPIPTFYMSFIPSLKVLNMSYLDGHLSLDKKAILGNAENLEVVDFAHNNIHNCFFTIEGLSNLKSLNISDSDCSNLKPEFLFGYGNLTELSFRQAGLAEGLKNDPNGIFLSRQTNLLYLDLCCNGFLNIHDNFFSHNKKIGSINLSNNKLQKIPESVLKSESLHHLDMSFNVLSSLNEYERRKLDSHVGPGKNFSLMLYGNPFICSCSTMDFLEWLAETNIVLDNAGNYSCVYDNGTQSSTSFQIAHLQQFGVKCVSDFWLRFSVIGCSLTLLGVVVSAFGYRYRWNIKYWFLTRCTGRHNPEPEEEYSYDVFVAYNHEDYQWVCGTLRQFLEETGPHKYRLCLHHRDFPVGQSIQSNIVSAMNDSRKIILVLTTRFLSCTWGEYEMEIAAMRDATGCRPRNGAIIAVLLDDVSTRTMPKVLLNMWKNITFLVWSQDPLDEHVFWSRLVEAMER